VNAVVLFSRGSRNSDIPRGVVVNDLLLRRALAYRWSRHQAVDEVKIAVLREKMWCRERDLNPHVVAHGGF
jgi:hypothetical protein